MPSTGKYDLVVVQITPSLDVAGAMGGNVCLLHQELLVAFRCQVRVLVVVNGSLPKVPSAKAICTEVLPVCTTAAAKNMGTECSQTTLVGTTRGRDFLRLRDWWIDRPGYIF